MAFYVVDNPTLKAENPPPPGTSPWNLMMLPTKDVDVSAFRVPLLLHPPYSNQ